MARTGVRQQLPPAQRREHGPASSREAKVRPAEISLLSPAQARMPRSPAIGALLQRRTPPTTARQQCRCDRFPPPQWPTMGSRRTPEPGALPAGYNARYRATRKQSRTRKPQMLLSAQRWTPESRSLREKKAALLLDMGSVDPGYSACGSRVYATRRAQGRWERQYTGCSRASAGARPKHIDEYHHRRPGAAEEIQCATQQPRRARG